MNSLYKLFQQQILNEGRKESVMAKFPDVDPSIIEAFVEGDGLSPEDKIIWKRKDNKYLEWMVEAYEEASGSDTPVEYIVNLVKNFYTKEVLLTDTVVKDIVENKFTNLANAGVNSSKFAKAPKDIKTYPNVRSLGNLVSILNNIQSEAQKTKQTKSEGIKISSNEYDGKKFNVIVPTTHAASCHYGKFSKWCVATSNTDYYYNYMKDGNLYFFVQEEKPGETPIMKYWADKTDTQEANTLPFKTALLIKDNGNVTWWSKADTNYASGDLDNPEAGGWVGDPKLPFFTNEIANKILNRNKESIITRSQKEIQNILNAKGALGKEMGEPAIKSRFTELLKSNVITPEQAAKVVMNDNFVALVYNNEIGIGLRKILGKEKVFDLFFEILNSYDVDLDTFIRDLDLEKFLTSYADKNFTPEECIQIANKIIKMAGSKKNVGSIGRNVSLFVDKWTMSPEDLEKYRSQSDYFFIGYDEDGEKRIKSITQVDRFDDTTHDIIHIMMYEVKGMKVDATLRIVKTEKDLLKDYIKNPKNIPQSMVDMLFQKSRELPIRV